MNTQPLVSIGIPTFNRPEGLRFALESLTAQTYKNLEIIVSDNASTNPLVSQVMQEFLAKDIRIKFYPQLKNQGSLANFIFVLKQAKGQYFMWASDDDLWKDFFVEDIITAFSTASKSTAAIGFEAQYCDENYKLMDYFSEGHAFSQFSSEDPKTRLKFMLKNNYGNLVYSIFKLNILQEISNLIFATNEIPLLLQVAERGNFKVLPKVGLLKTTNPKTYQYAKWEKTGGWVHKSVRPHFPGPRQIYYNLKYHFQASIEICNAISGLLFISTLDRFLLKVSAVSGLVCHLVSALIGYKRHV